VVVMVVLSLSLVQALVILPRNLSRLDVSPEYRPNFVFRALRGVRGIVDAVLQWFIRVPLDALLRFTTQGLAILIPFNFFPSIDGDFVTASIEMNDGTTFAMTERVAEDVRLAAIKAGDDLQSRLPENAPAVINGINVVVGQGVAAGGPEGGSAAGGATLANVVVQVTDPTLRDWSAREYESLWREAIGQVASVNKLTVSSELIGAGDPVAIELSLPDGQDITPVVDQLRDGLRGVPGLYSIRDDNSAGRLEYKLALREEARLYGLTLQDLAVQTRAGFFGVEATKVQRGADNVAVTVRFPKEERNSLSDLLDTRIATQTGDLLPLSSIAYIEEGLAPTQILRRNGRQVTTITIR